MSNLDIKFKRLTPFKRCVLQNFPFIEEDFDALTNYGLLCKIVKYLNDVIASQNEVQGVTEEIVTAFNNLYNYVKNYFDNLDVQDEINNKLDQMVEDGTFQEIIAEYATTKVDYFYIDDNTSEEEILKAFASEKSSVIEFKNGSYTLTNPIILSSNTVINLNGASIINPSNVGIFGYSPDSEYTGYNGIHNVKFNNGTIDTCIALMHNSGIEFNSITFGDNCVTHNIQIASSENIIVNNCKFSGLVINDELQTQNENIQIELASRGGQPYLLDEDSPSYDLGYNKNIRIINCKFDGGNESTTRMYSAIGNHSNTVDHEIVVDGFKIEGCYFGNSNFATLTPCGFSNGSIDNCIFNQTNELSWHGLIRFRNLNKNIIIENCTFNGGGFAIMSSDMSNYNEDIKIVNNTFDSDNDLDDSGNIILRNFKRTKISNNTFLQANYYNIYLINNGDYYPQGVEISGNSFDTSKLITRNNCIALSRGSDVNICNNIFKLYSSKVGVNIGSNATSYSVKNNAIVSDAVSPRIIYGDSANYENIDGMECNLFTASSPTYSAITSQAFSQARNRFNRLRLILQKSNDAAVLYDTVIYGYDPNDKISLTTARSYPLTFVTSDGTAASGLFELNNDGTFSYSSEDSIVLRRIFGFNDN